ncbi:MAG: hypothetical protein KDD38_02230 [Bdellovibrionales bacterium]|nr:hypothetical protein [Bdellovibrionales bacterium]
MIVRASWTVIIFILAISLGARLNNSALHAETGDPSTLRVATAVSSVDKKQQDQTKEFQISQMAKDFEGGEQDSQFIQSQLNAIAGGATAETIHWDTKSLKGHYKLTQILTHVHNLENNFELLFTHTLPDQEQQEDTVTHYTNKVNEADEKSISASIVFSRFINSNPKKAKPEFDSKTRAQYFFRLKPNVLKSNFSLRPPSGTFDITPTRDGSFDPLAILTNANGNFDEISEYVHEIAIGPTIYVVNVTPRLTDLETLTIEVNLRESKSLTTTTFLLVYEQ